MIQAYGKFIIVKPVKVEKKELILTTKEPEVLFWEVTSVGEDVKGIVKGDNVCLHSMSPKEVKINNIPINIVPYEAVCAKITWDD